MAGLATPVLTTLSAINATRSAVRGVRRLTGGDRETSDADADLLDQRQDADLAALRARQDAETERREAERRTERERIGVAANAAERRRQRALRRAVGRTRAQLGAQGISTADGSGEAILLGQINEAEEEEETERQLDRLRIQALTDAAQADQRRNLLERAQLQERQRLERLARGS